jgi:hypothetical protein
MKRGLEIQVIPGIEPRLVEGDLANEFLVALAVIGMVDHHPVGIPLRVVKVECILQVITIGRKNSKARHQGCKILSWVVLVVMVAVASNWVLVMVVSNWVLVMLGRTGVMAMTGSNWSRRVQSVRHLGLGCRVLEKDPEICGNSRAANEAGTFVCFVPLVKAWSQVHQRWFGFGWHRSKT